MCEALSENIVCIDIEQSSITGFKVNSRIFEIFKGQKSENIFEVNLRCIFCYEFAAGILLAISDDQ